MTELAASIARALLRWARKLGKQILERLAKRAGPAAVAFFRSRAAAAERRRMALFPVVAAAKKGTAARRRAVFRHQANQRLRNLWTRFADWLERHLDAITPAAVRTYCAASKAVLAKIPLHSLAEQRCEAA